ncbi:uncharacterized protein LOC122817012 isoform X2 [Protopterus annectens]|uniref:uncharacterized protein LOC122817012 isoform X2 n=1 Tax=Protopterus annectens TaxID=7888 RepID=UPI001CFA2C15|nr:uncharacterized protein LOC122817012 isoform X2 [Protopterus annectens]
MLRLIYCVSIANAVLIVPVRYNCTEEIPCTAWREPNVQYRRVSWYKVNSDSSLSSLINKSLRVNNSTILYTSVKKAYKINENCSLTLPGIESEDLGIYRCLLWAPVGHKMQNGDVKLTLEGIEIKELSERLESPLSIPEKSGYSNSLLGHVVLSTVELPPAQADVVLGLTSHLITRMAHSGMQHPLMLYCSDRNQSTWCGNRTCNLLH